MPRTFAFSIPIAVISLILPDGEELRRVFTFPEEQHPPVWLSNPPDWMTDRVKTWDDGEPIIFHAHVTAGHEDAARALVGEGVI